MKKAVLLSIHHRHAQNILAGLKTIELRKNCPKLLTPFKVYLYETKADGGAGAIVGEMFIERTIKYYSKPLSQGEYNATVAVKAKLPFSELLKYANPYCFLWHIKSDSVGTFVTPEPLSTYGVQRAPQSWCYVEIEE